jgi:hypothetical protein
VINIVVVAKAKDGRYRGKAKTTRKSEQGNLKQ